MIGFPMKTSCLFAAVVGLALAAQAAAADVVATKDGREIKGKIVGEEGGKITVKTPSGEVSVPADSVSRIEDEASLLKVFDQKLKLVSETDADGFFKLSEWCDEKGLFEKREEVLEWVIAVDFDHEAARKALGYVRDRSGAWIRMAKEQGSNAMAPDFKKALRHFKDGEDEKAEQLLAKILEQQPGYLEARYLMFEIMASAGKFGQAYEALAEMLKADKNSALAHYGTGYAKYLEKKYVEALAALKLAAECSERIESQVERKTLAAEIYYLCGASHVEMGEKYMNDAEADFLKCIALNSKHYRAWADMGIIYGNKGVFKKAHEAFTKALAGNSKFVKARYNWGVLYYRQGELLTAMQKLQPLVTGSTPHLPSLLIFGRCYQRTGKGTAAKKYYQQYIKLGGTDPRAQEWLAEVE